LSQFGERPEARQVARASKLTELDEGQIQNYMEELRAEDKPITPHTGLPLCLKMTAAPCAATVC
jgi:hypothetical protein